VFSIGIYVSNGKIAPQISSLKTHCEETRQYIRKGTQYSRGL